MKGNLWRDDAPPEERPLDVLVYRSRLIGSDPDLVVWGGGNTSVKTVEIDHLGHAREVLRIKGSGTDLKTIDASGFPGVFRDEILPLLERTAMSDEEMAAYLGHCMVEPGGPRPSIETLLHAFLPARHVDHVHADAILALTNTEASETHVRQALGETIGYVPYRRPGFVLAREVFATSKDHLAVVLANHGLVTWGDTARESYRLMIELVGKAGGYLERRIRRGTSRAPAPVSPPPDLPSLLLELRGRLGRVILHLDQSLETRAIAGRDDVRELAAAGPATADHVLRIRPWACVLDDYPTAAVDAYVERYRTLYQRYAEADSDMLDPSPRVFFIPGTGMVTSGKNSAEAAMHRDVAFHALRVATLATDAGEMYKSLCEEDLFRADYWPLELAKLKLEPPPREYEGRVIVVTGAASGIGRAVARHLACLGAELALFDVDEGGLEQTSALIIEEADPAPLTLNVDVTDAAGVRRAVGATVETFGGIDGLVSNAGIGAAGALMDLTPEAWRRSMDINATSHFLVTAEVMRAMRAQGLGGSVVYVASKNAFGPGAGFGAYSAAKAAQVQLARVTALEGGPLGIRSNVVNPDAVFEDSRLWSPELRADRASAHGIDVEDVESFYRERNLLRASISGRDVAEAVSFLLSDRSRATTGTVITVDGGVAAAFPR